MSDPFLVSGPAVISFSGGRTSGYMLWRIIQAHGGTLPEDVVPVFANTGREMPATLDFVQNCRAHWGAIIVWLEFAGRRADGYERVSHNSASRAGEPFDRFLALNATLPNGVQRSCTTELKIRTIKRFCMHALGWTHWTNVIGLRADEPRRLVKGRKRTRERWKTTYPLADAGVTQDDVMAFWREQPFDLGLAGRWEGNCDGCFLKSNASLMRMMIDHPDRMRWWEEKEAEPRGTAGVNRRFRNFDRQSYADLRRAIANNPRLPVDETMIEGGELCGAHCGV